MTPSLKVLVFLAIPSATSAFSNALFQEQVAHQKLAPSKTHGVDIELPDFDELFGRIELASPLARTVIHGSSNGEKGFKASSVLPDNLKWKTVEKKKDGACFEIQKVENFGGHPAPLVRFRSTINGPCVGECFANFIMDANERRKWDVQIDDVYEAYPIHDLDAANIAMQFGRYGDCSRLGIGYCITKANLGISPREQQILCGIQDFPDGSCMIWGTELEEWHDHLLPADRQRVARAKSRLFATILTPTGPDSFDVEYVLQLEPGGKLPVWLTTPVMIDAVKQMFVYAKDFFQNKDGQLEAFLKEQETRDCFEDRQSLLMTP